MKLINISKFKVKKIIILVFIILFFSIFSNNIFGLICSENFCYIEFNSSTTWQVPQNISQVDVLVVGGGGAGGSSLTFSFAGAGGGGAGGLIYEQNFSVTPLNNISIIVGNGGLPSLAGNTPGGSGEDSSFGSLIAIGGGGGSGGNMQGLSGGSGGGSRGANGGIALQPGSISGGFGNRGGNCPLSPSRAPASGGGGAGSAGQDIPCTADTNAGDGGDGLSINITGTPLLLAGGGGGGASRIDGLPGNGGSGIGGAGGSDNIVPTIGVDGTGSGGGGGNNNRIGARGGRGIVIVRFVDNTPPQITINSPLPITYQNARLLLNLTVTDNVGIDEIWYDYGGNNFTYINETLLNILSQGENNLTVFARDLSGNIANQSISFQAQTPSKICRNDICVERVLFSQLWQVPPEVSNIDVFLVGGGGSGGGGAGGNGNDGQPTIFQRGVVQFIAQEGQGAVDENQGGSGGSGGGNRGNGTGGFNGSDGSNVGGGNGGTGQGTTTRAFGEINGELFAGGGGGTLGVGGTGGGGSGVTYVSLNGGSVDAQPNTGGGGGAGAGGPGRAGGGSGFTLTELNLSVNELEFWNITIGSGGTKTSLDAGDGGSGIALIRYQRNSSPIIISPLQNSFLNNSLVLINFTTIEVTADTQWFFNGTDNITYTSPMNISLEEGEYNFTFYIRDTLGDLYIRDVEFEIDITSPALNVFSPLNNTIYNPAGLVLVNFTATDKNLDNLWYFNGTDIVNYTSEQFLNLSLGNYSFTFFARDFAGNIASEIINFTVDNTTVNTDISPNNQSKFFNTQIIELNLNTSSPVLYAGFYLNNDITNLTNMDTSNFQNWFFNLSLNNRGEYNITFLYTTIQNINFTQNISILVLESAHRRINKSIRNFGTNVYLVNVTVKNMYPVISNYTIVDFSANNFNFGSFNIIYDLLNTFFNGRTLIWSNLTQNQTITYSITNTNLNSSLLKNYRVGFG